MKSEAEIPVAIAVNEDVAVSAVMRRPAESIACVVLAPGAGAGMHHPFMTALADGLAAENIATLRYQFPYMERNSKRPDAPPTCHATVRAAVATAHMLAPELPLFAGGKSFGGRMTSQAQALTPLAQVSGLVFLGFPLHPPMQQSVKRAEHLRKVGIPMLFLQGTRDDLADLPLLRGVVEGIGNSATVAEMKDADHSFHVLKRSGRTEEQVRCEMVESLIGWIHLVLAHRPTG